MICLCSFLQSCFHSYNSRQTRNSPSFQTGTKLPSSTSILWLLWKRWACTFFGHMMQNRSNNHLLHNRRNTPNQSFSTNSGEHYCSPCKPLSNWLLKGQNPMAMTLMWPTEIGRNPLSSFLSSTQSGRTCLKFLLSLMKKARMINSCLNDWFTILNDRPYTAPQ